MSPEEINAFARRRPFIPFRLHISNGITYDITNPEFFLVGRTTVMIAIRRDPSSTIYDEPAMVAVRHIVQIEPLEIPSPDFTVNGTG